MRRILTTGALLAALTGAGLALSACEEDELVENDFQIDAGIIENSDATPPPDAVSNPMDADPTDADPTDADTTD